MVVKTRIKRRLVRTVRWFVGYSPSLKAINLRYRKMFNLRFSSAQRRVDFNFNQPCWRIWQPSSSTVSAVRFGCKPRSLSRRVSINVPLMPHALRGIYSLTAVGIDYNQEIVTDLRHGFAVENVVFCLLFFFEGVKSVPHGGLCMLIYKDRFPSSPNQSKKIPSNRPHSATAIFSLSSTIISCIPGFVKSM